MGGVDDLIALIIGPSSTIHASDRGTDWPGSTEPTDENGRASGSGRGVQQTKWNKTIHKA
jgi:hypothetical protein